MKKALKYESFYLYNEKTIDISELFWYNFFRGGLYDIKTWLY